MLEFGICRFEFLTVVLLKMQVFW